MVTAIKHLAGALAGLREDTEALVERLRDSVVVVRDGGRGAGSGVIWSQDGLIVTNFHVVRGAKAQVELRDGRRFAANTQTTDPEVDLAVLKVEATGLPAASVGDSDKVRVGELVFAAGNPLGLQGAVNAGIITAAARRGRGQSFICADVSLAPGNSGGMLATADGSVIGINSMMRMPGMALAVPSNAVRDLLAESGAERGSLGLTLQQVPLPAACITEATGDTGFLVTNVRHGGPAEEAGVMVGDIVIGSDGDALAAPESLTWRLRRLRPDESLQLTLLRGGRELTLALLAGRELQKAA
jgi:serine protease Do